MKSSKDLRNYCDEEGMNDENFGEMVQCVHDEKRLEAESEIFIEQNLHGLNTHYTL